MDKTRPKDFAILIPTEKEQGKETDISSSLQVLQGRGRIIPTSIRGVPRLKETKN